jgi:serine phosphatase RsbU (regulator of sigma subunit)
MLSPDDLIEQLRQSEFLRAAPDAVIVRFGEVVRAISVKAGEAVIRKGEPGTTMYIVSDGLVRVHDDDLVLKHLSKGDVFGEMAALTGEVRSASITAEVDTTLIEITQQSLRDVLSTQPEAASGLLRVLAQRERNIINDVTERSWQVRALEHELEIGRQIQTEFLPKQLPKLLGWDLGAYFRAAHEVAGDFYDVFWISSIHRVGLVIGDVCDKGVGAALFMTLFRSLLRATSLSGDFMAQAAVETRVPERRSSVNDPRLRAVQNLKNSIALTNNYVSCTHAGTGMFASIFFGLLGADSGSLLYINGGHEAPVIFGRKGTKARLDATGPAVGIFPGARFEVGEAQLEPFDTLLAFTDGVTEAIDEDGKQYSESRLLSRVGRSSRAASALLEDIVSDLRTFTAGAKQSDDITMLAIHRTA